MKTLEKTKLTSQIQLLQLIKKKIQAKSGILLIFDSDSENLISHVSDSFTMESIYRYLYQSKSIKVLEFVDNPSKYNEIFDEYDEKYESQNEKNSIRENFKSNDQFNNILFNLKQFILYSFYLACFKCKKLGNKIGKMRYQEKTILFSLIIIFSYFIYFLFFTFKYSLFEQKPKYYRWKRPEPRFKKFYTFLDELLFLIVGLFE